MQDKENREKKWLKLNKLCLHASSNSFYLFLQTT